MYNKLNELKRRIKNYYTCPGGLLPAVPEILFLINITENGETDAQL
jgi:hypothetical protein